MVDFLINLISFYNDFDFFVFFNNTFFLVPFTSYYFGIKLFLNLQLIVMEQNGQLSLQILVVNYHYVLMIVVD